MTRNLRLRRETLTELTPSDLVAVRAGDAAYTVGDHCGPPFDTKWLDGLVRTLTGPVTGIRTGTGTG
jgi:hypothetical protein